MNTIDQQIKNFAEKCDEMISAKFILADSKISELLKSIVTSETLLSLFEKAAADFDYAKAKEKYMLPSPDGTSNKGVLLMPESRMDQLAFIFCLLADFDNRNLNFSAFLQKYFYEDGSYSESFSLFNNQIITPLKSIIVSEFQKDTEKEEKKEQKKLKNKRFSVFAQIKDLSKKEIDSINETFLSEADKFAATTILTEIFSSADAQDIQAIKALLLGYNYFILYHKTDDSIATQMFNKVSEL